MLRKFIEWSIKNNVKLMKNDQMFFISERQVIKPDFRVGESTYIDIISPEEISQGYLAGCAIFADSYGTLVVIPTDVIAELENVTKKEFEERFQIVLG